VSTLEPWQVAGGKSQKMSPGSSRRLQRRAPPSHMKSASHALDAGLHQQLKVRELLSRNVVLLKKTKSLFEAG